MEFSKHHTILVGILIKNSKSESIYYPFQLSMDLSDSTYQFTIFLSYPYLKLLDSGVIVKQAFIF